MTKWDLYTVNVAPGESWYDAIRKHGDEGWEPWHIDGPNEHGYRTLYFKRPKPTR